MSDAINKTTTFEALSVGDVFQITAEHRKKSKLPLFTYRKSDEFFAVSNGTRGIFRPTTSVIRIAS